LWPMCVSKSTSISFLDPKHPPSAVSTFTNHFVKF
jgi:hypothetical protein